MILTQKYLREILDYDPESGLFRWSKRRPKIVLGTVAGTLTAKGAVRILIHGRGYYAHRLVWLYVHGRWPPQQIDHIDLDRSNNRLDNLREASNGQNCAHRRPFGASGLKGASRAKSGKWRATMTVNKKAVYLGEFLTAEEAHAAYAKAAKLAHGPFARSE